VSQTAPTFFIPGTFSNRLIKLLKTVAQHSTPPSEQLATALLTRSLIEEIARASTSKRKSPQGSWEGCLTDYGLILISESAWIYSSLSDHQIRWLIIAPHRSPVWHIDFSGGEEELDWIFGSSINTVSEDSVFVETPAVCIRRVKGTEVLTHYSFELDGEFRHEIGRSSNTRESINALFDVLGSIKKPDEFTDCEADKTGAVPDKEGLIPESKTEVAPNKKTPKKEKAHLPHEALPGLKSTIPLKPQEKHESYISLPAEIEQPLRGGKTLSDKEEISCEIDTSMVSYCKGCNKELKKGSNFCPRCGKKVELENSSTSRLGDVESEDTEKAELVRKCLQTMYETPQSEKTQEVKGKCPGCGFMIRPSAKFCGKCGYTMKPSKA